MKDGECSRCGDPILVDDEFDPYEDLAVCLDCVDEMNRGYEPRIQDYPL